MKEAIRVSQGGSDSACEREGAQAGVREGARVREGDAEGKAGASRPAAVAQGARARVQARARAGLGATVGGTGATPWIALPALICARPKPFAVALIGRSPEVVSMLAGLRRGDLVEVEGELTLADLGHEGARLGVIVATARLVTEVGPEVAHEA